MRRRPCVGLARKASGTPVAVPKVVRCLAVLVGVFAISCAARVAEQPLVTSPARLAWLKAEMQRTELSSQWLSGKNLPRPTPGADIVCALAIAIDPWYGAGDETWEVSKATLVVELARMGIRDCILDTNR